MREGNERRKRILKINYIFYNLTNNDFFIIVNLEVKKIYLSIFLCNAVNKNNLILCYNYLIAIIDIDSSNAEAKFDDYGCVSLN